LRTNAVRVLERLLWDPSLLRAGFGGGSLGFATMVLATLVFGLVLFPLKHVGFRPKLRGNRRETLGVALLVFALLVAGGGVAIGIFGKEPWLVAAVALVAVAVVIAAAGAAVLWLPRRTPSETIRWHG
jgi:hypothetical protein